MKGKKIFHEKKRHPDGSIVEMKIWQVQPDRDRPHGLKYSLTYIEKGKRRGTHPRRVGRAMIMPKEKATIGIMDKRQKDMSSTTQTN